MKIFKPLVGILLLNCFVLISCSRQNHAVKPAYQFTSSDGRPDYSKHYYWAAHPWKWDPSDSIPADLRNNYLKDSLADVFFLYPTSLIDFTDNRSNAPLDDASLNAKTDYSSILYQASAFSEKSRLFAPRYRQAHLKTYYSLDSIQATKAFNLAYQDIKDAFEYYLTHYNSSRPFIIAAHSQGTTHAARLIKEMIEGKPLQQKLICAYLIGMPVREDYFSSLLPCTDPTSTGCFVSWRTYKKGYTDPKYVATESFKAIVTNPITWDTTTRLAPASLNKGSVLQNFNKVKKGVTDAQVHRNILWSQKPKFFGNVFFNLKNYHIADINFFYVNISENVKTRIRNFKF